MSATAFAQTIISKLSSAIGTDGGAFSENTASTAMAAVAAGITEYLIANTLATVSYSGLIPGAPPVPDPLVTDIFQLVGSCSPTGPSSSFDDWIKQIEANIISGFQLAPVGLAGLMFPQKAFLNSGVATSQSLLKSVHDVSDTNPQLKVWTVVCGGIMDWINGSAMNTTQGTASNPLSTSTGTASITKITIA